MFEVLWLLFSTSFLSATLLPGGSEANLIYLLQQGSYEVMILIVVATSGNTLGGMVNYGIGRFLPNKTKYSVNTNRSYVYLKKYGYIALLFSWLPIIGDPLCLMAGWLRFNWLVSFLFIAIGKFLRYTILTAVILKVVN